MNSALKRQRRLDQLVEKIRSRDFPYEPKEQAPRDWGAYTEAQVNELDDILNLIRDTVDAVPRPPAPANRGRGRPRKYEAHDLAKALLLQQYFEASNRVCEGYTRVFKEKLGLSRQVHHKAIERAYEDRAVRSVLDQVFALTQQPAGDQLDGVTLDGSGLPTSRKQNWESDKNSKSASKHEYDGSVTMLSVPFQLVTAHSHVRVGRESESPSLEPLLRKTCRYFDSIGIVTGDAAYLSRDNCDLIKEAGALPRFGLKRGITLKRRGSDAWARMLDDLLDDPQQWLREYHQRSLSETGWNTHKARHRAPLRRRLEARQPTERHVRFTLDNLVRLGYLRRLGEIRIPWFSEGSG